jgi:hypothetical protein
VPRVVVEVNADPIAGGEADAARGTDASAVDTRLKGFAGDAAGATVAVVGRDVNTNAAAVVQALEEAEEARRRRKYEAHAADADVASRAATTVVLGAGEPSRSPGKQPDEQAARDQA